MNKVVVYKQIIRIFLNNKYQKQNHQNHQNMDLKYINMKINIHHQLKVTSYLLIYLDQKYPTNQITNPIESQIKLVETKHSNIYSQIDKNNNSMNMTNKNNLTSNNNEQQNEFANDHNEQQQFSFEIQNGKKSTDQFYQTKSSILNQPQKQEQIIINYDHKVKQIIDRQKPFIEQLSLVKQNKKIKISNDIYKGQIDQLRRPQGYGILIKSNKSVLIGNFVNGVVEGNAFFVFNNGSYYKGLMKDSKANDLQGQFHSQKLSYKGGFQNNQFHGECIQIGDDYYFKGVYKFNKKVKGNLKWELKPEKTNSKVQQNTRSFGVKDGNSFMTKQLGYAAQNLQQQSHQLPPHRNFNNISKYKYSYEGSFNTNQQFEGQGVLQQPNGIYNGEFKNGKKHGKGVYVYQTKIKYEGEYQHDQKSGYGTLYNCDDTIAYAGGWKNGLPNGKGISYDLQGRKTQGQFILGLNSNLLTEKQPKISKN